VHQPSNEGQDDLLSERLLRTPAVLPFEQLYKGDKLAASHTKILTDILTI
jgi:hypothetical protein